MKKLPLDIQFFADSEEEQAYAYCGSKCKHQVYTKEYIDEYIESVEAEKSIVEFKSIVGSSATHIVKFNNGKTMFIDTGLNSEWTTIKTAIDSLGITKFDYGIVTHCHVDHVGNLQNMFDNYDLDNCTIYTQGTPDFTNYGNKFMDGEETAYNSMMSVFSANNCTPVVPANDSYVAIDDDTKLHFMNTDTSFYADYYNAKAEGYSKTNNNFWSLITEIIHKNVVMLCTGDMESSVEEKILPFVHRANLITGPHHMVNMTAYKTFYEVVKPDVCIAQYNTDTAYLNDNYGTYRCLRENNCSLVAQAYNDTDELFFTFISNGYTLDYSINGSKNKRPEKPELYRNIRDVRNANQTIETEMTLEQVIENMIEGSILKTSTHANYSTQFPQFFNDLKVIFPFLNARWWNIQINKGFNSEYCEIVISDENLTFKAMRVAKTTAWKKSGYGTVSSNVIDGGRISGNDNLLAIIKKLPVGHYISTYQDDVGTVLPTDGAYNISIDVYQNEDYTNVNATIYGVLRGSSSTHAKAVVAGYINTYQSQQWWKVL